MSRLNPKLSILDAQLAFPPKAPASIWDHPNLTVTEKYICRANEPSPRLPKGIRAPYRNPGLYSLGPSNRTDCAYDGTVGWGWRDHGRPASGCDNRGTVRQPTTPSVVPTPVVSEPTPGATAGDPLGETVGTPSPVGDPLGETVWRSYKWCVM